MKHEELHESVKAWLEDEDEDVAAQAIRIMAVFDDLGLAVMLMNQLVEAFKEADAPKVAVTGKSMEEFVLEFKPPVEEASRIIRVNGGTHRVQ